MKTAYFDIDGFLARFMDGACVLHKQPIVQPTTWNFHHAWGLDDKSLYAGMGRDFWAELPVWRDGFDLLARVMKANTHHVVFVTSPCQTAGCEEGKREWAKRHLVPLGFDAYKDVFIGGAKHKLASPRKILLDDSDDNIEKFSGAGGAGWLVPRPWNKLAKRCYADGTFDMRREGDELIRFMESVR